MKTINILFFLFLYLTTPAQKYSNIIKDSLITNFMTQLLIKEDARKETTFINKKILSFNVLNFDYRDTSSINNSNSIFSNKDNVTTYFKLNDAKYLVAQINQQQTFKWNFKIKNISLITSIKLKNNRTKHTIFSYSLPIFSLNGKYALIIEAFYCGLVCGGGAYAIYEKQENYSWKKIKTFNEWAE